MNKWGKTLRYLKIDPLGQRGGGWKRGLSPERKWGGGITLGVSSNVDGKERKIGVLRKGQAGGKEI